MRLRYITLFIVSMLLFSCHKDEENNNLVGTAQWEDTAPVSSQKGNTAIQLQGNPGTQWYAHITEGEEWCSFALSTATSDKEGSLDPMGDISAYLYERIDACLNAGIDRRNLLIDPSLSQSAPIESKLKLIGRLETLKSFALPMTMAMPMEMTTQEEATRRERVSLRSSSMAIKRSRMWGMPK